VASLQRLRRAQLVAKRKEGRRRTVESVGREKKGREGGVGDFQRGEDK
jgi:hypothetical protein